MKSMLHLLPIVLLVLVGCTKDRPEQATPSGSMALEFLHEVDGDSLEFAKMIYKNAAGNVFRVLRLKYFISGVSLFRNGKSAYYQASPAVVNAMYPDERQVQLRQITAGNYDSLSFSLGVVPNYNFPDALQLSNDNLDMYWPTSMGGGYHFMKFEGHWQDADLGGGYAFHIGQNENLITTGFPVNLKIEPGGHTSLQVAMNVNQWFEDPYLYDLTKEGGYTMGDSLQMGMLLSNGQDVFSLKTD